jgi:hypothetical protein
MFAVEAWSSAYSETVFLKFALYIENAQNEKSTNKHFTREVEWETCLGHNGRVT